MYERRPAPAGSVPMIKYQPPLASHREEAVDLPPGFHRIQRGAGDCAASSRDQFASSAKDPDETRTSATRKNAAFPAFTLKRRGSR